MAGRRASGRVTLMIKTFCAPLYIGKNNVSLDHVRFVLLTQSSCDLQIAVVAFCPKLRCGPAIA